MTLSSLVRGSKVRLLSDILLVKLLSRTGPLVRRVSSLVLSNIEIRWIVSS